LLQIKPIAKRENVIGNKRTDRNKQTDMKKILLILFAFLFFNADIACTVYKITMNGKTFMGNNEDYWNPHTRIWFEKGKNGNYGSSYVGFNDGYPQGGINEKGLAFDGFAVPSREIKNNLNKLTYDTTILRKVMQNCQNTDEVYTFLSKYDLSPLYAGMLLFVDQSGKYLVVEGDTMIKGNDDKYLLSNFCPSKTKDVNDVNIPMYQSGRKLMAGHVDTSLDFLKTLSDTLHQSWPGNIGGTLYTTIYDLNERTIHLYFYHDYTKSVTFKLADELNKKEDRVVVNIPKLFPNNTEGQDQLKRYNLTQEFFSKLKTPSFSKDSLKMAHFICINDIEPFLPLYEGEINSLGYYQMDRKNYSCAVNIFKLNVKYHKNSSNAYDSLAEAYFKQKKFKESKEYYQKSLVLNPNNQTAIDHLKVLDK
jgi:tetratricopeptide (TPR) repeat protein